MNAVYPPPCHRPTLMGWAGRFAREHSFAHLITAVDAYPLATRIPLAVDVDGDRIISLRGHLNRANPQARALEGRSVLASFSGPDSYVSPYWRTSPCRGPTWDYSALHIWGRAKVRTDADFFSRLVDDLASHAEARMRPGKRAWSMADAPREYVERLRPAVCAFVIHVDRIEPVAKFHQDFPSEDAHCVAEALQHIPDPRAQEVSAQIRSYLPLDQLTGNDRESDL